MDRRELMGRAKQFGLRVMKLVDALPQTASGRAIANQLVRSGMGVGANYRSACQGRSRADFISRLGIVVEEADECVYWLELIIDGSLLQAPQVHPLHEEARELTAIFTASPNTARRNHRRR
ncbi:MAG: four helix bundle protein [Planctomycetes bacterium]|nr:four helix bundle protein [Planctomycetota bacterium]